MTQFDFSPLFRSTIGFDRLSRLVESALNVEDSGYPPYNIEKTGNDAYRITMAVAGFGADDVTITVQENALIVSGKQKANGDAQRYLHRGIAGRTFERRFQLADFIKVTGAALENGLLHVELVREVPEAMKPRTIKVESRAPGATVIENKAAA
jgi:molecular chaperone IbpA